MYKNIQKFINSSFKKISVNFFFIIAYVPGEESHNQLTLLTGLCDLVAPLVWILGAIIRKANLYGYIIK